jgi:Cytochrome P450
MVAAFALIPPLAGILLFYVLVRKVNLLLREKRFVQDLGCQKLRRSPQKDPILGLDLFFRLGEAARKREYLQEFAKWFKQNGPTFGVSLMGDDIIFTNEPKNIQAMLVTQFKDFELGERRRANSAQMLGVGVFNADGKTWEHGRALVRPNFTRKQVADLQMFEKHVQSLIRVLPADGSPVDVQGWIFRFVGQVPSSKHFYSPTQTDNLLRPLMLEPSICLENPATFFDKMPRKSPKVLPGLLTWVWTAFRSASGLESLHDSTTIQATTRPAGPFTNTSIPLSRKLLRESEEKARRTYTMKNPKTNGILSSML